ncbi:MAG: hypothetical protein J7L47_05640 [Candidatus Odinarchaeota archaeon]|nr:hypothetical protein [Candidatus Odinarchaeota archaeon]
MIKEKLRVTKITRDDNWEKDRVTFKVTLKSRDDNIKLTLHMNEQEFNKFESDYAIHPGVELLFLLKRFQRTLDEFEEKQEEKQQ